MKMAVVRVQWSEWKVEVNEERPANERIERTRKRKDRTGLAN